MVLCRGAEYLQFWTYSMKGMKVNCTLGRQRESGVLSSDKQCFRRVCLLTENALLKRGESCVSVSITETFFSRETKPAEMHEHCSGQPRALLAAHRGNCGSMMLGIFEGSIKPLEHWIAMLWKVNFSLEKKRFGHFCKESISEELCYSAFPESPIGHGGKGRELECSSNLVLVLVSKISTAR